MQRKTHDKTHLLLVMMILVSLLLTPQIANAQATAPLPSSPMEKCRRSAFSTEEDFVMRVSKPSDGDPYISDGDILSPLGDVCMRNRQLLQSFAPVGAAYPADLGLDGLEIIKLGSNAVTHVDAPLISFSTEIDDLYGNFSGGDLLFSNGAIIPNQSLTVLFGMRYDIGLDGIQWIGDRGALIKLATALVNIKREEWIKDPQLFVKYLKEYKLDLWFSIEQDFDQKEKMILGGDVITAVNGTVVVSQDSLFPAAVPAGIPDRGVDFGLDGLMVWRSDNPEIALKSLRFSSEILYEDDTANAFTDGDILRINGGVETLHESLIHNFYPPADFLGLDALSGPVRNRVETPDPMITKIGGYGIGDINEGAVLTGGGTGAFPSGTAQIGLSDGTPALPYRPFGTFIPVDGILQADTTEFRVMYKNLTDPGAIAQPIRTQWTIDEWTGDIFDPCDPTGSWGNTGSADGWFDAAQYRNYRFTPGICPNTHLLLAVWDSKALPDVDENDHYIIWLEYRTTAGGATTFREAMDHHVQLDNTAPKIVNLELRTEDGNLVPPCGGAGAGVTKFNVYAEIRDEYFDQFVVNVKGGNPPNTASYNKAWYPVDLTDQLDRQGTTPAGLQFVQQIDMTDLGASFVNCCYLMEMYAYETTIHHNFNGQLAYLINSPYDYRFTTFAAAP